MINGLGNLLSFADINVSSNNNSYNSLNDYNYDDSFANMLNKTKTEEIHSSPSNASNKSIEKHLPENNNNEYNNYDEYNTIDDKANINDINNNLEKKVSDDSKKDTRDKKVSNDDNSAKEKYNVEDKAIEKSNSKETKEKAESDKLNNQNTLIKDKLTLAKEKAKIFIKNNNIYKDKSISKKEENINNKENISEKTEKKENNKIKENTKNIEEIENIKKQIEALNIEELDEDDKKELSNLIESLENIKSIIEKSDINNNKLNINENEEDIKEIDYDNLKAKDIDYSKNKEIKIESNNKENNKNTETEYIINKTDNEFIENASINITDTEIKYTDKKDKNTLEIKNGAEAVKNTISDEKGAELTIINMKDSAEGSNLKGYNHYNNNVSKTQNGANITDNMIKFQDLMGKLVEKAQVAVNNGKSEVLMSLNPEHLGKIRLKINMDGDNLIGKIFVDNADIKDIFSKNLDTVIASLNEIGVNIEGFDIMLKQDMPNNEGEFQNFERGFGFENNGGNVEEVNADIKAYIIPEKKLNLLI